jgi:hypothetical protein
MAVICYTSVPWREVGINSTTLVLVRDVTTTESVLSSGGDEWRVDGKD